MTLMYHIFPVRKEMILCESLTFAHIVIRLNAVYRHHIDVLTLDEAADDQPVDLLLTGHFPPLDEGKFNFRGTRYLGGGVIVGYPYAAHDGVLQADHMIAPIHPIEFYADQITF